MFFSDATFLDLVEAQNLVDKNLAQAYSQCRRQVYIDEEVEYLKRKGVLLPNGFEPLPPLFSEEGEALLERLL